MIPIRDSVPCYTKPVVVWVLMTICMGVFLWMLIINDDAQRQFIYQYGMVPIRYARPEWAYSALGLLPDGHLSFFTNLFLHSGWIHIISNLIFMWIFADNIEDLMGHWRFLAFYFVCGVLATYAQWYADPKSIIPVVGASGAIAGVLGAYFMRFPYARVIILIPVLFFPLFFEIPAIAFLGVWVIFQLQDATTAMLFHNVAVTSAWWAHIGGFVAGVFLHPLFVSDSKELTKSL